LLILFAALSWSIYFALQKHYSGHYSGLTTVCYMVWAGTLLLCVYAPGLAHEVAVAPLRVNVAVLLLGIFPSALAYLAWAYVLSHSLVSRSSIALYLIPPVAMLMAALDGVQNKTRPGDPLDKDIYDLPAEQLKDSSAAKAPAEAGKAKKVGA